MITGGIRSDFQRFKFNYAAISAKMKCFNPLWRLSPRTLLSELLENNFHVIFSSVAGMGLGKELLGKKITNKVLESLQKTVPESELTMIGEGGEFESLVLDAPFFPYRIKIIKSKILFVNTNNRAGFSIITYNTKPLFIIYKITCKVLKIIF